MSAKNPYDDYDKLDPRDSEPFDSDYDSDDYGAAYGGVDVDGTANFEFVEDEYDSMDQGVDEGFVYPNEVMGSRYGRGNVASYGAASGRVGASGRTGSTAEMPRTQVRPAVAYAPRPDTVSQPQGGVLRRRRKNKRVPRDDRFDDRFDDRYDVDRYDYRYAREPEAYAPTPEDYGRGGRQPRTRRRHHFGCLFTILCFVAIVVGVYWVVAHPIDDQLAFSPAEQQTVNGALSWNLPGMPYYVLALGSDAREGEGASRTDTMMLVRVDLIGGKLTMMSIPRDTMVDIDGYGTSKINAAYAYGEAGGAVRAVTKLTGVPIHHVAVVHFEELVDLVDYLGGVTVNVPVDVYDPDYSGLNLSAGIQTMDGQTALLWARSRHGFADGDYQRQEDQRILLTAIMNRMLSLSPREVPGALRQIGDLIGTDMRCYDLVPLFLRFKLANPTVYSCSLPTTSDVVDGLWYEIVDQTAMQELMRVINAGGDPSTVQ